MAVKMGEAVNRRVRAGRLPFKGKTSPEAVRNVCAPRHTMYYQPGALQEHIINGLREMGMGGRPGMTKSS